MLFLVALNLSAELFSHSKTACKAIFLLFYYFASMP